MIYALSCFATLLNFNLLNVFTNCICLLLQKNFCYCRKRQAKMQKELEDAARDTRPVSPDRLSLKEVAGLPTAVPTKVSVTFVR